MLCPNFQMSIIRSHMGGGEKIQVGKFLIIRQTTIFQIKDLQATARGPHPARDVILSGPRKNCAEMRQLN
jgi:hypothetical protein